MARSGIQARRIRLLVTSLTVLVTLSLAAGIFAAGTGAVPEGYGNNAPVASSDLHFGLEDTPLTINAPGVLANDSDPDGDPITAQLTAGTLHGASFELRPDGSFTYVPLPGFVGTDTFRYKARDANGALSAEVVVSIEVGASPEPDA